MDKVLYIQASNRHSTEAFHWCLHKAKEDGRLLRVVCVSPATDQAKKTVEAVERQCRTFQIKFETELAEGAYTEICLSEANKAEIKILTVVEEKQGFFKKLFSGKDISKLIGSIPCELKVYPPDKF